MKLYNPFKSHIVEYETNKFTVRKLPWYFMFSMLDGDIWIYMDASHNWYFRPYDPLNSIEKAKERLERLEYKKPPKFKPKVHTV